MLLGFTGFYWVLLSFTGFFWVLLGLTGFYRVLLGFTGFLLSRVVLSGCRIVFCTTTAHSTEWRRGRLVSTNGLRVWRWRLDSIGRRSANRRSIPFRSNGRGLVPLFFEEFSHFLAIRISLLQSITLTGFYWVLLGFTEYYWVLLGFTGSYWVLLFFFRDLLGFTGFYWVSLDCYRVLLGITGFYWVLPSFTGFYWVFTEFF